MTAGRRTLLRVLLGSALFLPPGVARADDPGPPNATYPGFVRLVGHDGVGTPDPRGRFTVTIRDLASNPIPGVTVILDLINAPDLRLCATPALPDLVVSCAGRRVLGVTNAQGQAEFAVFGHATQGESSGPGARLRACMTPYCLPGEVIFDVPVGVSACDQTGGDGVNLLDLTKFLADFGTGGYFARSDHNHDGSLGAADFAVLLQSFGDGRSAAGCAGPAGGTCP